MTRRARMPLWAVLPVALCAAGPASAQPSNTPYDSNGNGTFDSVIVDGDYDGDGQSEPEDIQAAVHAVASRLPGEAGSVVVRPHTYRELCRGPGDPTGYCAGDPEIWCPAPIGTARCQLAGLSGADATCVPIQCEGWDTRPYAGTGAPRADGAGLIDLGADDADLTLACDPGARIEGIPNKRRFDGTSPSLEAGGMLEKTSKLLSIRATSDVTVSGCDLDGRVPRGIGAYDPLARDWPLVADGGTATTLVDAAGGWRDSEWALWWLLLRPGCDGPQAPYAWCSAAEEFVQILASDDATDTLSVAALASPPAAGDRYAILYHSGGACSGDRSVPCLETRHCQPDLGQCDRSVDDDPRQGSRMTVYVSGAQDVVLRDLRISGSAHAGLYVKNSRRVELRDSELLENGGWYGRGYGHPYPSIYLFSGVPEFACFDGDVDCRLQDVRIVDNEIHHGPTAVNLRWSARPGQQMYIEGLVARGNHIHDLFFADGSEFPSILCSGGNALCEDNLIERVGRGIVVGGQIDLGWASETDPVGGQRNSAGVSVRNNVVRGVWRARGAGQLASFGIDVGDGNEDVSIRDNVIESVAVSSPTPSPGFGMNLSGPNRRLELADNAISEAARGLYLGAAGDGTPVGVWEEWPGLEVSGEDLGPDPNGFTGPHAIERIEIRGGGRLALRDEVDAGNRGGVGGPDEALYVGTLVFDDATGLLNRNGLHLYVNTLSGDPDQIVNLPTSCPNGVLDAGEQCDDGDNESGDGCSAFCRMEEGWTLFGVAEGGSIELVVEGVTIRLATAPLDLAFDLLGALATAINADPDLQERRAGAVVVGGTRLMVAGSIESVSVDDAGLSATARVPALGRGGRLLLAALLVALAAPLLARRAGLAEWRR